METVGDLHPLHPPVLAHPGTFNAVIAPVSGLLNQILFTIDKKGDLIENIQ